MPIEVTERKTGKIILLDFNEGSGTVETRKTVEMNFSKGTFFDANWIHLIVRASDMIRKSHGHLHLVISNQRQKQILHISKLDTILDCFDDESEALEHFQVSLN